MLSNIKCSKIVPGVLAAAMGLGLIGSVWTGTATPAGCNTYDISANIYYIKLRIDNKAGQTIQLIFKGGGVDSSAYSLLQNKPITSNPTDC